MERSPRVLVIEDEHVLRNSMVRGISKLPGIEVVGAGTFGEALALVEEVPPVLILSDLDLPDRSGIEMIGELRRMGFKTPIVFVSAYLKAFRAAIPPHAGVEILEKPVGIDELRSLVERYLTAPGRTPDPFSVSDYLQLAALGRHSVLIEAHGASGAGRILVFNGELWSAEDEGGSGLPAFCRLAFGAALRCQTLRDPPGVRNLEGTPEALLLEAARLEDEAGVRGAQQGGEEPVPEEPVPAADPAFDEMWELGLQALIEKRHADALQAFLSASELRPEDRRLEANIARLQELLRANQPR